MAKEFERCKYANECVAECSGASENAETCDSFQLITQLKRKEQECDKLKAENEEMQHRLEKVIYRATGGRLSYATYTLDAIEQAFQDQLDILSDQKVKRETKNLCSENEELKKDLKAHKNNAESYYNSYKQSCECNGILNDKIAKLQDEYETAQTSATRASNIGKKYLKALDEIEDNIFKTLSIGGLDIPEKDGEKILDIIAKAKGKE